MALTSALFPGLSGLNANQTKLNVIGNNIANTNTTAFKSSRAEFSSSPRTNTPSDTRELPTLTASKLMSTATPVRTWRTGK